MLGSPADSHAEKLEWLNASWSSIDLRLKHMLHELVSKGGRVQVFDQINIHYLETSSGRRFLDETYLNSSTGKEVYEEIHVFDGIRGTDWSRRLDPKSREQVVIHKHFYMEDSAPETKKPVPLYYQWVGRRPLHEAIRKAQYLGEAAHDGKKCDTFLFVKTGWTGRQDRVYYLDKTTSVPLKVVSYLDGGEREKGRPSSVWTATEIKIVQGYPFAWNSLEEDYTGEGGTLSYKREYKVDSIVLNKVYDRKMFQVEIGPDALVIDTTRAKSSKAAAPTQKNAPGTGQRTSTSVANPVRAEAPRPWSDIAPGFCGALGVLLLVVSFILWRRRSSPGASGKPSMAPERL